MALAAEGAYLVTKGKNLFFLSLFLGLHEFRDSVTVTDFIYMPFDESQRIPSSPEIGFVF